MKKLPHWEIKYNEFVYDNRHKPFEWGVWDCCKFSNALIKAMTNKDLIPKTLKWKDEQTAKKSIKDYGGTLLKSIIKVCKANKIKEIDKNFMTKGDLVVYMQESELVGICDGSGILGVKENGIELVQNQKVLKVWRIEQ